MADKKEILIDVKVDMGEVAQKLSEATARVNELKDRQKELKAEQKDWAKQLKDGSMSLSDFNAKMLVNTKEYAANSAEIEANSRVVKSSTAILQTETMARLDENASLDEQRQLLNAAQKAYAQLSGEEKVAADASGGLRDQIDKLSESVKKQEAAIGDNRRNVGNYAGGIEQASKNMGVFGSAMNRMVVGVKSGTSALKAMSATPAIAILSMLVTIITKLSDRFKGNAAAMERLNEVMGVFSGIGNMVNKIIDKIAAGLGWIAEKALQLAEKLGILTDSMKAGQEIAREELDIQKAQQEAMLKTAEDTKQVAELKAEASNKEKHTAEERMKLLKQASKLEEDIAQRQYDLAKREYDLQVKKNAQSESSQADLKKENDLKIAMLNAETALFNKQKELNSQLDAARQESLANQREAAAARLEIERKLEDSVLELERDATQKSVVQAKRAGEREVENLRIKLEKLKETDIEGREKLQQLIVAKEQETQQKINDILIKAQAEREAQIRANARAEAEIGLHSQQELNQMRYDAAQEDYDRLINLSKEYQDALYANDEQYKAAVLAAQAALFEAQEAQARDEYQRKQEREANQYEERKNAARENEVELANIEYEQAVAENERLVNMDAETKARLYSTQEDYEAAIIASNKRVMDANKKAIESQRQMASANAQALGSMMGALSGLLDQFGEENEEAAKASKLLALGKVAVETGVAIASGVAQSQSVPFPANLAAIATTIATVVTNMATAISTIKSAKFAGGGIVEGTSYTGDKVPVLANSREMFLNLDQQTRLFDALSGRNGSLGFNYELMAAAVAALPAPKMVYSEFRDFQDNVATYNEIASV